MSRGVAGVVSREVCGVVIEPPGPHGDSTPMPEGLDSQVRLLRSIGLRRVTVSPSRRLSPGHPIQALVIEGGEDGLTPIHGIVAAMRASPHRHLFVLRSDLTPVERSILLTLLRRCRPTSGACLRIEGRRWEPLCAVYPPNSLSAAEHEACSDGTPGSLLAILLSAGRISGLDLTAAYDVHPRPRSPR